MGTTTTPLPPGTRVRIGLGTPTVTLTERTAVVKEDWLQNGYFLLTLDSPGQYHFFSGRSVTVNELVVHGSDLERID